MIGFIMILWVHAGLMIGLFIKPPRRIQGGKAHLMTLGQQKTSLKIKFKKYRGIKQTPHCMFCFLKSLGVRPVLFLNRVLKEDLELNPTSYITSRTVIFLSLGLVSSFFASSIL